MIMLLVPVAFYYLAVASVASAMLAVTRRDPVHSMLWVLALFLHVAGIFLLLSAEFLAAVQVIVYAGAILVFYLFVLMLLDVPDEETGSRFSAHWPLAAAGGLGLTALVWIAQIESAGTWSEVSRTVERPHAGSLVEVGQAIFGPFALPFEMTSLVLLAAIVGAVVLARRRTAES
ncbi:MAG: NADH-quinone oxidoreductase subunit J [Pirellulales bacterium]